VLCARRAQAPAAEARVVRPQGGPTVRNALVVSTFVLAACSRTDAPPRAPATQRPNPTGVADTVRDSVSRASVDTAPDPRFAVWRGDTLWVRLASGDSIPFANVPDSDCCGVSNHFLGTLPSGHLVVETAYEDGISVSVIEPRHGHITAVGGEPLPSPSGRRFATNNEESYSDARVTVWRLDTTGDWVDEFDDTQGPAPNHLQWLDDSTLSCIVGESGSDTGVVMLERRGGQWQHREP